MRVPELKSNYSWMRKTELVAFLTIWVLIILCCAGSKGLRYLLLHSLPMFHYAPRPATFTPTSVYLGPVHKSGKDKVTKYPSIKISYTGNYLFL